MLIEGIEYIEKLALPGVGRSTRALVILRGGSDGLQGLATINTLDSMPNSRRSLNGIKAALRLI